MTAALVALGVVVLLVLLLIWTSRRWGPPRLHVRGVKALWLVTGMFALIVL